MAGILLTRARIHDYLRSLGHEPTSDLFHGTTGTYRWWMSHWGQRFAVPDEDYKCATWELERIVELVDKTKPTLN